MNAQVYRLQSHMVSVCVVCQNLFHSGILIFQTRVLKQKTGTSLEVQWLRLRASTPGGMDLISSQESSTCHTVWPKRKPPLDEPKNPPKPRILRLNLCPHNQLTDVISLV